MGDTSFWGQVTPTTYGVFGLLLAFVGILVKTWPLIKAKLNDLRKIELDADADRRGDLYDRIRFLEEQRERDRKQFDDAMAAEKARCDAALDVEKKRSLGEMADMRREFNRQLDDMMRIITQNSRSTAQMLGRPGDIAESKTARED